MNPCKYCGLPCKPTPSQVKGGAAMSQCNSCSVTKKRWRNKIEMVAAKGGKCIKCGWTGHPSGFDFHHRDPAQKLFSLNGNKLLTEDRWDELKKCDLVCSNCHNFIHTNTELMKKMGLG